MTRSGLNFAKFNTHDAGHERAFEAFCNHLFEHWLNRQDSPVIEFRVINGSGGDGGIEAYGKLQDGRKIGIQAKWYLTTLQAKQIRAIKQSILTALDVHGDLTDLIVAVPRDLNNKRRVRGAIAKSTEQDRFDAGISKVKAKHSNLRLIFWGKHQLEAECFRPENSGVLRYWFDSRTIDFTHLTDRLHLAQQGWLSHRYIPDLHTAGFIQSRIEVHLRYPEQRKRIADGLRHYSSRLHALVEVFEKFEELSIQSTISNFRSVLLRLASQVDALANGTESDLQNLATEFQAVNQGQFISDCRALLEHAPVTLRKELESLAAQLNDFQFDTDLKAFRLIALESHPQYVIFRGRPGTGKTHALANAVQTALAKNIPAIIIQARSCPHDSLAAILKYGLDAFDDWTADDILAALESLAHLCRVKSIKEDSSYALRPKTLVCIDGLDEAPTSSWHGWVTRMNELAFYVSKFPSIQFVISFRTSFDTKKLNWNDHNRIYDVPKSGDVPVSKVFKIYADKYRTPNDVWIGYALTNLLSLRLFCEIYRNKRGDKNPIILTSLSQLIARKTEVVEEELAIKLGRRFEKADQVLLKAMNSLTDVLIENPRIRRSDLIELIVRASNDVLSKSDAVTVITLLCAYGVITEVVMSRTDASELAVYVYYITHQSIIEFMMAKRFVRSIVGHGERLVPAHLVRLPLVLQITSDILATDYAVVPKLNGLWSNIDNELVAEVSLVSISHLPPTKAAQFKPWIKSEFLKSSFLRNLVIWHCILPSIRRPGSPFNALFLHEILSEFGSPFERDVVWSGPSHYDGDSYDRITSVLEDFELTNEDKYNELPLILGWSLTSLDNRFRERTRVKLTAWAFRNLDEMRKLAKLLFLKYDPQLDEDLSMVLLGAATLQTKHSVELERLSDFLLETVFCDTQIRITKSSVIRHACRLVVERCNRLKSMEPRKLQKCRPPYNVPFEILPLETVGPRDEGRYPIQGDLAWYVIDKSTDGFMESGGLNKKQIRFTEQFLKRYSHFNGGKHQFALSAAIVYIRSLGFHQTEGRSLTKATHGSMSDVSTFEEKYTWLAVHHLQGYMADNLPYLDDFGNLGVLTDYVYKVNCHNPANSVTDTGIFPKVTDQWKVPTDISPRLHYTEGTLQDDIKKWVDTDHGFNFEAWHLFSERDVRSIVSMPGKKWIALRNYTSLIEPAQICMASVNSAAFTVREKDFPAFIEALKSSHLWDLRDFEPSDLCTKSYAGTAIDAIWIDWIREWYPTVEFGDIEITKLVCEVDSMRNGESITYVVPSRQLCRWLDIRMGDGHVFLDANGRIVGFCNELGEAYHDHQELLLIDYEMLETALCKAQCKLVWSLFRFQKSLPVSEGERKDFQSQRCQLSFVWKEGSNFWELVYHVGPFKNSESEDDKRVPRIVRHVA